MKYIDYVQLNPFQKFFYNLKEFFVKLPKSVAKFFKAVGSAIVAFFMAIINGFKGYFTRFAKGDWATKTSYLVMGTGNFTKGQIVKGLLYLGIEAFYIYFMMTFGSFYLIKFATLGTVEEVIDSRGKLVQAGDNSMLILLYGVLTIVVTLVFFALYIANTKSAYNNQKTVASGKKPIRIKEEIRSYLDGKFHTTLLSFPVLTISIFTILPLIFMILIAFTNFDANHLAPAKLFTWVGLKNFGELFETTGGASMGYTFMELTKWTLIWAVVATFSNYILGMIIALMINKKGIKFKPLWRTLFVITVAVPQFVSLLLMSQMLARDGAINTILTDVFGMAEPIDFLNDQSNPNLAKITVLVVNCWVGIPYTILITSGILMNIPVDLYESATIDGAGPVTCFMKITLPYMLFVTTPHLITQFIGNINNFNVIYLLSGGGPRAVGTYAKGAGYTDLLVTWLFKMTIDKKDYSYAAAVGILVFVVCATVSLITFNMSKSSRNEEEFS